MKRLLLLWLLAIGSAAAAPGGMVVKPILVPPDALFSVRHPSGHMIPGGPNPSARLPSATEFLANPVNGERGVVIAARHPGYQDFEKAYPLIQGNEYWDPALNGWRIPIEMTPKGGLSALRHQFRFNPVASWGATLLLSGVLLTPVLKARGRAKLREKEAEAARLAAQEVRDRYDPDISGRQVGDYKLLRKLGEGSYAHVYQARHSTYGDMFALKILRSHVEDEQARSRVYRELEIGRTLNHPNLVRIVGFGDHLGSPYLVMDYIEGPTLTRVLEQRILAQGEVLGLFRQMCDGVAYAHRLGVIHRDLKPDNMILTADGTLKILDFGVARPVGVDSKLTGTGQGIGTPAFMAPEQLLGSPVLESDIYALGVILFMLLTSRLPFDTDDCTDILAAHLSQKAPRPSSLVPEVRPELDELCEQMLAKPLEQRIRSVDLVLQRLDALEANG